MDVISVAVPSLGNRTHLVHDGEVAVVVDPPRDLRAVEAAAEEAEVDIAAVAETHVHNDYVSGGLALARRHGADLLVSADEHVAFERLGVRGGDRLRYGRLEVEVLATPGHTRHHQSFVLRSDDPVVPAALLSGGSLLVGTVGRTDLVHPRLATLLAGAQWESARRQAGLAPSTRLLPTHGFGSFCAGGAVADAARGHVAVPTVGAELTSNPALTTEKETFVTDLVAGFGPVPAYYPHMDPLNRAGVGAARPRDAHRVTADDVTDAVLAGAWVVDLRDRAAFAAGHVPGAVNVELGDQFATYVGWLVPWGDDIVLLTDSPEHLTTALTDLAAIGIDGVGTHVLDVDDVQSAGVRRADWAAYREARALAVGVPAPAAGGRRRPPARRVAAGAPARRHPRAAAGRGGPGAPPAHR